MKIVNRKTLMSLPAGTVYMEYEPCIFRGLFIKGETLVNDWCCNELTQPFFGNDSNENFDILDAMEAGASAAIPFEDGWARDAMFEHGQLYAVYERADLDGLLGQLLAAKEKLYGEEQPVKIMVNAEALHSLMATGGLLDLDAAKIVLDQDVGSLR